MKDRPAPLPVQSAEGAAGVSGAPPAMGGVDPRLLALTRSKPRLKPLPRHNDDYPDKVSIDVLAKEYKPAELPHGKIVARLDAIVRESNLAKRFHGETDVLCAGCHHQSPVGTRPPQCRACHGSVDHPTQDKPALKIAYHQQCIGCHQKMNITKALGCTDCHAEASKEVTK